MKKILIIEDEAAYLELLKEQLIKKGYTVIEAINGKKGLAAAKTEKPDLILLDIRMPVMDGLDMLTILRKEDASKKTKVIMLTNLEPDDRILEKVLNDQPAYYCVKSDTHFNDLLKKIAEVLAE